MQTFLVSATNKQLYTHVTAKHDKISKEPEKCFPCLKGFDPNAPEQASPRVPPRRALDRRPPRGASRDPPHSQAVLLPEAPKKKKAAKKKEESLDDLLSAGLSKVKVKK